MAIAGILITAGVLFCGFFGLVLLVEIYLIARAIHRKVENMARTEQELETDLAGIKGDLDQIATVATTTIQNQNTLIQSQKDMIAALQAQIAAGSPVTQDQLDNLAATADAIKAQADSLLASLPGATPAAAPAAAPASAPAASSTDASAPATGETAGFTGPSVVTPHTTE